MNKTLQTFLLIILSFLALQTNAQIKTGEEIIAVLETPASSLESSMGKFKLKYHTTTANVMIFKGSGQDVYIKISDEKVTEVVVRNMMGTSFKGMLSSLPSDCALTVKQKNRKVYTGSKYIFTFVTNNKIKEVALNTK
jgi:hypothetical protein